nr:transcription regulator [Tanacetum cinerariifolium]
VPKAWKETCCNSNRNIPTNASLQARLLESGNSLIHPSVQEAIGAGQQRNDISEYFMLLMQDLMLPVVISYANAAIDTTATGFKRRKLVAAVERRETPIEAPASETQDKISFIINRLLIANIEPKANEFTKVLKEEYYPWFAQYTAPPSETQDKISFIINNLLIANIEPKAKEFIKF